MPRKIDEGVIKFKLKLKKAAPLRIEEFINLEKWRAILFRMKLIGEYLPDELGYGNLSARLNNLNHFIISGTQTGKFPHLNGHQYTKVIKCDLSRSSVEAIGPIAPSSESLTHYAIYQSCPQVQYIFHVHHNKLWQYMIQQKLAATNESVAYGTTEMAKAVGELIQDQEEGIFVMKGHQDGIIAYGKSAESTGRPILDMLKKI